MQLRVSGNRLSRRNSVPCCKVRVWWHKISLTLFLDAEIFTYLEFQTYLKHIKLFRLRNYTFRESEFFSLSIELHVRSNDIVLIFLFWLQYQYAGLFTDIYDNILQEYNLLHNEDYLRHNLTRTTLRFSGKFTE